MLVYHGHHILALTLILILMIGALVVVEVDLTELTVVQLQSILAMQVMVV